MPVYRVLLTVFYKKGARDPEGETLAHELRALGYRDVEDVRAGKAFAFTVEAGGREEASRRVLEIAGKTRLYNPVVHEVEVVVLGESGGAEVPRH
ncbi:phosphoribosylformylglycinamidine synthase subunit PurS [Stetteria hydrogenophila]